MLVILFGSTIQMGKKSRQYFIDNGFEAVQKYNYIPEDFALSARFEKRRKSSKEEVLNCDFVYKNNGMLVGFNKEQIADAVQGKKKCLISLTSETIDFIRQMKVAYGEYVKVIGVYIDDRTLKCLFEELSDITEEELRRRVNTGLQIKKYLISDRKIFDYIVMYGGEDSAFNYNSLEAQYNYILEQVEQVEKKLNNKKYAEMPYAGTEEYIFVSYSHRDAEEVFSILHKLQFAGFRIWYDEGINGGENWRKILALKIQEEKCKEFLLFSSENSVKSRHVKAEINLALDLNKKITTIRLDRAKFDLDLEMYLSTYQYLSATDDAYFEENVIKSLDEKTRIQ